MKKSILFVLSAMLLLASGCKDEKKASNDIKENVGTNVTVYTAVSEDIDSTVAYTGEIMAVGEASVSAKVAGKVLSVNAELGQYVNAGDVLFTIDSTDYRLQYNQAQAAYNSAQAAYNSATGGAQQQAVNNLKNSVIAAETEYNNALSSYNREKEMFENNTNLVSVRNQMQMAKNAYDRTASLFDMGAASKIELDNAKAAYENAQAAVTSAENGLKSGIEAAKARLVNAENNLKAVKENYDLTVNVVNPESAATAKAQVDACKATLDIAKNALDNTTVTAPISGYISSKNISKGEMVGAGVPVFTVSDISSVEGEINVTESVISHIEVGSVAEVSVKAADVENIKGEVCVVNTVKNAQTGLYTVRVKIPNNDAALKAGMFADIVLTTQSASDAVTIPNGSIMQSGSEKFVWVADEATDTAEKKVIVTGIDDGVKTQIISGVESGDKVIVLGKEYLSEKNNQINITDNE